jgi:hypothetical protein
MSKLRTRLLTVAAMALLWGSLAQAATVRHMNLEQMVGNAGLVFRGTLLDVREGTIQAGGAELPTVTYRLRVEEAFKGSFQEVKGQQIAEIKMIGKLKSERGTGTRHQVPLPEVPRLQVGQDYLLLTTQPSSIGLSTTVGLMQGNFVINGKPGQETVINGNNNVGLFLGMNNSVSATPGQSGGPVSYSTVAEMIRNIVGG